MQHLHLVFINHKIKSKKEYLTGGEGEGGQRGTHTHTHTHKHASTQKCAQACTHKHERMQTRTHTNTHAQNNNKPNNNTLLIINMKTAMVLRMLLNKFLPTLISGNKGFRLPLNFPSIWYYLYWSMEIMNAATMKCQWGFNNTVWRIWKLWCTRNIFLVQKAILRMPSEVILFINCQMKNFDEVQESFTWTGT
jgi:hypothetical protein